MKITLQGRISKEEISRSIDLEVEFNLQERGEYTVLEYWGEDEEIFGSFIKDRYEEALFLKDVKNGIYSGTLVDVGKVGYGIYCDFNCEKDALISLASLRETFGGHLSTRQYIQEYGIVEGLCVEIMVTRVDRGTDKIWASFAPEWKERVLSRKGTILVSMCTRDELEGALGETTFAKHIKIDSLCETSHMLTCLHDVDPPGIVSLLGKFIPRARFGIVGDL